MAGGPRFRKDGAPDGRGLSEGSKSTQFAAGDQRKRPGRPKGSKSLKDVYLAAAAMPVEVKIGNRTKRIATKEAVVLKQRDQALKQGERAAERFIAKVEQYTPLEVEPDLTAGLLADDAEILAAAFERGLLGNFMPSAAETAGEEPPRPPSEQGEVE